MSTSRRLATNIKGYDYDDTLNFARNTTRSHLILAILFSFLTVAGSDSVATGDLLDAPNSAVRNGTPFSPLSSAQRKALKAKVDARTITKQEYQYLQWDRRFGNRRATGVRRFWAQERAALRAGEPGTRAWTDAQRADILAGRTPKFNGESIEGHHHYNALDHPHIANEAWNIYPATKSEHFNRWHGGNWRNDTFGQPLNPLFPEDF